MAILTFDVGGTPITVDCEKGGHAPPRRVGGKVLGFAGVETSSTRAELMVVPVILAPLPWATLKTIRDLFALGAQVPCEGDIFNNDGDVIVCSAVITDELHEVGDRGTMNLTLYEIGPVEVASSVCVGASTLVNHYDAQGTNFAALGLSGSDPVLTWPDETANGFDATSGNPSFTGVYDPGALNGNPGVYFEPLGNNQRGYDLPNTYDPECGEAFIVMQCDLGGGGAFWAFGEITTGPDAPGNTTDQFRDNFGSTVARTFGMPADPTEPFLYHVRSRAGQWRAWINGTLVYSTSANTTVWDSPGAGSPKFGLWLAGGSIYTPYTGFIGELKVYENFMSDAAAATEEAALMTKWGIAP